MIKKAIITAAGFGSRFLPITKTIPKEMLPVIDKPIIHWVVDECASAGIEEIIIVVAPDEVATFEKYFYGNAKNIKELMYRQGKIDRWKKVEELFNLPLITVIPEDRNIPYGNGRPVLTAKKHLENEEAFVVCFGDDMILGQESSVKQLIQAFENDSCDGLIAVEDVSDEVIVTGGAVKIKDGTKNVVDYIIEKPSLEEKPSNLFSYGRFVLTPKIFDYLTPGALGKDNEVWLQDANSKIAENHTLKFKVIDGKYYTTGDPDRYLKTQIAYASANQ